MIARLRKSDWCRDKSIFILTSIPQLTYSRLKLWVKFIHLTEAFGEYLAESQQEMQRYDRRCISPIVTSQCKRQHVEHELYLPVQPSAFSGSLSSLPYIATFKRVGNIYGSKYSELPKPTARHLCQPCLYPSEDEQLIGSHVAQQLCKRNFQFQQDRVINR